MNGFIFLTHESPKTFKCTQCKKSFGKKDTLQVTNIVTNQLINIVQLFVCVFMMNLFILLSI